LTNDMFSVIGGKLYDRSLKEGNNTIALVNSYRVLYIATT